MGTCVNQGRWKNSHLNRCHITKASHFHSIQWKSTHQKWANGQNWSQPLSIRSLMNDQCPIFGGWFKFDGTFHRKMIKFFGYQFWNEFQSKSKSNDIQNILSIFNAFPLPKNVMLLEIHTIQMKNHFFLWLTSWKSIMLCNFFLYLPNVSFNLWIELI